MVFRRFTIGEYISKWVKDQMVRTVSKYRDALMGVAILWVLLHHSGIYLPNPFFVLKRSGYGGVDIFMFLSGLGCVVSYSRNRNTLEFYKRRLNRIYPHYIPILALFFILNVSAGGVLENIRIILGNLTGFSFWSMNGIRFNWYILAIPFFYMVTPVLFEIMRKGPKNTIILIAISLVACFCFNETEVSIAVSRFPIYLIGMEIGFCLIDNERQLNTIKGKILGLLVSGCGIVGFACLISLFRFHDQISVKLYNVFLPFALITPVIVLFCSTLFSYIDRTKIGKWIVRGLSFTGKISLDIYLIHILLISRLGMMIEGSYDIINPHQASMKNALIWLGIALCIIGVSFCYNLLVNKTLKITHLSKK